MPDETRLERLAETMNKELGKIGLAPGNEIWVIRNGCYECPDKDDHCQIDCEKKSKKYLEHTKIIRAGIVIGDGMLPTYKFTDEEMNEFSLSAINVTVFTNREEALEKL